MHGLLAKVRDLGLPLLAVNINQDPFATAWVKQAIARGAALTALRRDEIRARLEDDPPAS
jgi:hypothetical protein